MRFGLRLASVVLILFLAGELRRGGAATLFGGLLVVFTLMDLYHFARDRHPSPDERAA